MTVLTRRHLLAAGAGSLVAGAGLVRLAAGPAAAAPLVHTDVTVRTYGPVGLIGDSTAGGYVGGLRAELVARQVGPFRYDIQGSRSISRASRKFPSSIAAVQAARDDGFDPPAWVVAVGANDTGFLRAKAYTAAELIDPLLAEIGRDRHVFFVNQYGTRGGTFPELNAGLADAAERWPRMVVVDWAALAARHPEWHGKDGTHYTMNGAKARNAFLTAQMMAAARAARAITVRPRQLERW